jgi:hypothetical protein
MIRDDAAFLPDHNSGRWVEKGDRLVLDLDLSMLARPQADRPPKLFWQIFIGLPDKATGKCPVAVVRPIWHSHDGIQVTPRRAAGGWRLDIRIAWPFLTCPPGKAGSALGFNARHISHDAAGKVNVSRQWAADTGWVVLA